MTAFEAIRAIALQQAAAVARGDLDEAVRLLDERAALLASAGEVTHADEDAVRDVLQLDRELAGAIRERMLSLREEAVRLQHARTAVNGYGPRGRRAPAMLDATR
jgi:hypothetical protein